MKIGIVGAGPSGIIAALEARSQGAQVILFDANPIVGRKLAATGSGRCNLTNVHAQPKSYYTGSIDFLKAAFSQFGHKELIAWLNLHGILTYATQDGWVYPLSNSAQNIVDILQAQLVCAGVEIHLRTLISGIQEINHAFKLVTPDPKKYFLVDRVILAAGGPAFPQLGARDNCYTILKQLGHTIEPKKPALAPLLTEAGVFHKLQGVRLDVGVKLLVNEKIIGQTMGNIIFTSWGLNGPGVMDISYLVSQNSQMPLELELDFLPYHFSDLQKGINQFKDQAIPLASILESVLPFKVVKFILDQCHLSVQKSLLDISKSEIEQIFYTLRHQKVTVNGTKGFKESQVSIGGVPLHEINPTSMESMIIEGLFLAGEMVDISGPCGGFNLQWAFTSGFVAGNHAGSQ